MKKIILILIVILISFQITEAQWMNQVSGTNRTLYDMEFLNKNTGWVVGVGGTIRKTTNGGMNWFEITHPVGTRLLSSIHLIDSNYAYIVGDFETIIKTTDGGNSWVVIRYGAIGEGDSYEGVFFINKDTGWICGTGEKVLRTTNGGITIDSSRLFWGYLMDIYFKDANTGVLTTIGNIFKTSNGGLNWNSVNIQLHSTFPEFKKVTFVNNKFGWVVSKSGNRTIYKTSDFGSNWDSINIIPAFPNWLYCIEFSDSLCGWVGGEQGTIYNTRDGGLNWFQQNSNTNNLITSMWFFNDSLGWTSCGFGGILNTTNGGLTHINSIKTMKNNFRLFQNYPNPFNPITQISYELQTPSFVSLRVYDILGNVVETLVEKIVYAGLHSVEWGGTNFSSGIYFYRLITGEFSETKKMILKK